MKSKKVQRILISLFIGLSLGFMAISINDSQFSQDTQVEASSARRAYVTHRIRVYHWIWGKSFATSRLGKSIVLHRGQVIHVGPFYHMGKDGYMLYVNGHGTRLFYARTNSNNWFRYSD